MKRLLILGGAEFQIPLVQTAKEMNLFVGIVDINANSPACKYADIVYEASIKDKEKVLAIAKEFNPDGVTVGMVDVAIPTYAYITTMLQLPGMDIDTAVKATDKYEMIKAFKENSVPHPLFYYVEKDSIGSFDDTIDLPVIVKPVDMAGSRGIYLVTEREQLRSALEMSAAASDSGNVIVEEYMNGPEVSVEMIIKDGIPHVFQVTDKTTSGAPHFAETGHLQPSQLPTVIINSIKEIACSAAKAIGLKNSLGHAEIKVTKDGPKMVEIGARAGGDGIAEQLIELSTGVSFSKASIQIAFGEELDLPLDVTNRASCIRFISSQAGVLTSISGAEEAQNIAGVKIVKIVGSVGKRYKDMVDNSGRIGYVISEATTAKEAKLACDAAMEIIRTSYNN